MERRREKIIKYRIQNKMGDFIANSESEPTTFRYLFFTFKTRL